MQKIEVARQSKQIVGGLEAAQFALESALSSRPD